MIYSIKAVIRALVAPSHRINCPRAKWKWLVGELARRGNSRHESGAFLLGLARGTRFEVVDVVFYDDLDPDAYATGVCVLHGSAFAKLWSLCRERGLTVVGDVHTHPGAAFQSESDRTNPMVARTGHVALILPQFARTVPIPADLGVYEYCGNHKWHDRTYPKSKKFFYAGLWS